MNSLQWITTEGGPLILISHKRFNQWSGIMNRKAYLDEKEQDAEDFLNPDETDYGKACLVEDYVGIVAMEDDIALVLGDEPLPTTVYSLADGCVIIVRHYYSDKQTFEDIINAINIDLIKTWAFSLTFVVTDTIQYLFDAACTASMLTAPSENCLALHLKEGNYTIWTAVYKPDDTTMLLIHKLEPDLQAA